MSTSKKTFANTDDEATEQLAAAMRAADAYYRQRGIFQGPFGFGSRPAVVVVDFAYGWTDDAYASGSLRLDAPVENTRRLLDAARELKVPIYFTTSPWLPEGRDPSQKQPGVFAENFRRWDERACQIDERLARQPGERILEKEAASALAGTSLAQHLVRDRVDTLLITGCSTSACIRQTAADARALGLRPSVIRECVGDRVAVCHVWTLFDIEARFADVPSFEETLAYLDTVVAGK